MKGPLTFADLFNQSLFSSAIQDLTLGRILLTLGLALTLGILIYVVYKRTFRGVLYSRSFNLSLVSIAMVTALVIMAVSANIVLSLGMVGALSIVRFRTAVKDPIDLVFLFWALAVGIVTGAGLHVLAVLGSILIGLVLFVMNRMPAGESPYLLVVETADEAAEAAVQSVLTGARKSFRIKSKTVSSAGIETTYGLRLKDGVSSLVKSVSGLSGVTSAVLISYQGDYAV